MTAARAAADTVFVDGAVLAPGLHPVASAAVAVRGGEIVAVTPAQVRELTGPRTEVVSLRGRLLVPGFVDAHVHPVFAGVELGQCDLGASATVPDYVRAVASYAAANPDTEWITGAGWSMSAFPGGVPHRRDLDAVVPDRPVYLPNRDHHGAWVNSVALRLAGIDARTPDPPDGRIERDADGSACGMLQEGATALVSRLLPPPSDARLDAALLRAQAVLHAHGVTGWQDAIVGAYLGQPDPLDTYLRLASDGRLTARVVGALWWDRARGAEQLDGLLARRERGRAGRFRATAVKIMQDGVVESRTAAMLAPYLDGCGCSSGAAGDSFIDPVELREHVTLLDRHGFQVHVHALGDRAVREALDAVQAARERNGPRDARHHLAHLQVIHPDDLPRFGALGVTANIQALWACHDEAMDELTIPFLEPQRVSWQYPFASLHAAGARLAAGSDWPVSSANPLAAIHVAVNRRLSGAAAPPFLPEQALPLGVALAAYTAGSAHVNFQDDAGRIEVGARADLAVLDRDIFAAPPDEIGAAQVLGTYVGGERVYVSEGL